MDLDKAIYKRRSMREFSSKKVKWSNVLEVIDAANQAPFAGNINNLKFIIVSEQDRLNEIAQDSQQFWVSEASYVVIVCADTKKMEKVYDEVGRVYSKQQVGAAIQNMLLKITDLKLAGCWIGAFAEDILKSKFKIPEDQDIEALIAIGYPSHKKPKEVRKMSVENKIYWEKWGVDKKPRLFQEPATR